MVAQISFLFFDLKYQENIFVLVVSFAQHHDPDFWENQLQSKFEVLTFSFHQKYVASLLMPCFPRKIMLIVLIKL